MTDIVSDVLHALFDGSLNGKYLVEVKASMILDADTIKDAENKALEIVKASPDKLKAWATRINTDDKI